MPGREHRDRAYRFGFNNKEKDDEVYGVGDQIDFSARIYDPRRGQWSSIDPLYKKFAYESNYTFGADNPILMVDQGGKTKTLYIKVIDKSGKETTIKLVNEKDVRFHPIDNGDYGVTFSADVHQDITIDLRKPTHSQVSVGEEIYSSSKQSYFTDHDAEGKPNTQKGGFHLVNGAGGVNAQSDKSESNAEIVNIEALDAIDAVLGQELNTLPKLKEALGGAEAENTVKDLKEATEDIKEQNAAKKANRNSATSSSEKSQTNESTKYHCTNNCGFEHATKAQADSIQKANPGRHTIKPESSQKTTK